jgi:hypothetical protein
LTLIEDIPSELDGETISKVRIGVECSRFDPDTTMYVDDITMVPVPH